MIVTDEFLAGSGILDGIKRILDESGVDYVIFDGVLPDPAFDQVQAGEATLRSEKCDAVIAVARDVGASAKFAGSGGAIVGVYEDERMFLKLRSELEKIGCCGFKPKIA